MKDISWSFAGDGPETCVCDLFIMSLSDTCHPLRADQELRVSSLDKILQYQQFTASFNEASLNHLILVRLQDEG